MQVILASTSPRRKEIFTTLGVSFTCVSPQVDETTDQISADQVTTELARRKADWVADHLAAQGVDLTDTLIVAADTAVVHNMEILGKPTGPKNAFTMLKQLSGNSHFVVTGVCLKYNDKVVQATEMTRIQFAQMEDWQINAYVATGEPLDKAGGYGIQGIACMFAERIEGEYTNVVGFPVPLFTQMLEQLDLTLIPGNGIVKLADLKKRKTPTPKRSKKA
ncbi:MAG: septum formation protein Maf [Clostridia bacterium]|nr:septum formation protein Maf [Clostridia bacterium]